MSTLKEISESIGKLGRLDNFKSLSFNYDEEIIDETLVKDREELRSRMKQLTILYKHLKELYEERGERIDTVKALINPIYEKNDRTRHDELVSLHKTLGIIRAERSFIATLQKFIKTLKNSYRSGISGIDYIKKNKDQISSYYVSLIHNGRFHVSLYTGENKN
jgi:hypothetical protein